MYKTIDLFAGAGGLSEGFEQTGGFEIVLAAENNKYAAATYRKNHPNTEIASDVRQINYADVRKHYGVIDLVIGGPPCQGFSNANRQKATISANNGLVKEFVRAVKELKPAMFVMENVSMLRSDTHKFYCADGEEEKVKALGLKITEDVIVLSDLFEELQNCMDEVKTSFEAYQDYLWDGKFYHAINILNKRVSNETKFRASWKKCYSQLKRYASDDNRSMPGGEIGKVYANLYNAILATDNDTEDLTTIKKSISVANGFQRMYQQYRDVVCNHITIVDFLLDKSVAVKVWSYSVLDFIICSFEKELFPYEINYQVLNAVEYGAPQRRERFIVIGSRIGEKPEMPVASISAGAHRTVRDAIEDLAAVEPSTDPCRGAIKTPLYDVRNNPLLAFLRDSDIIENHFITATKETAQERFDALEEGGNFHTLPDRLKSTYSDGKRTQSTIYLKLKYDEPSGTVINVRKSMWVHPAKNRALSVREAARLQTFPDSYTFEGTKDSQYQQVGNAVPPILAHAIAKETLRYLDEHSNNISLEQRLLIEMITDPESTQQELAERLGISQGTVSNYARTFIEDGRIRRTCIKGRRYRWELVS